MAVQLVRYEDVEVIRLPGRDLRWLADAHTLGTQQISFAVMHCPANSVVKPLHSHKEVEEVLLVLAGKGEVWVDGETAIFQQGDAVLLPAGSMHQVRNVGKKMVVTVSIFGCPMGREAYTVYEKDVFSALGEGRREDE
ncbi:MAG: cupin domain-containing protein [Clostridia bacterium]